ncbi:regulator of G-protein signaling 1 [Megalobrama amblycephala]|uniref:regulator of G-protein signaling 1 n=1 Tax=Megalobrama amblycephala TaxID=75352 RepID=UPI0020144864|nr:regulator of G-protein signaling 1 [Megalobrama amblycephala]XP_048057168.1 regulator of G-protein signaling 1 [Megalobrama amblycephala]
MLRKYSSVGALLELDFLPWGQGNRDESPGTSEDETDGASASYPCTPDAKSGSAGKGELNRDHSISVENLVGLEKESGLLRVTNLNDSFKAYSDSQIAANSKGSLESMGKCGSLHSSSSTLKSNNASSSPKPPHYHRQQARAKLAAAKLHLKSLFGQGSPQSSQSNLTSAEHRDNITSAKERRARKPFLRQWSQVGHAKARLSRKEMESWAKSLDALLESRVGVTVFEAFLRSEFSEENLQFYSACEQYRQSSNKFSLHRRAKMISETYIQLGAPREVNLDSKTRELTIELLKAPSHTSLSHAQKRIYCLLEMDCYPRFLKSEIYLALLRDSY